jgi:dynein heavy chain 1
VALDKGGIVTYKDLLAKLPGGKETLEAAYKAVEDKMSVVMNYVNEWLCYQSLWDLQPDQLYGKLGEDMDLWLKCLTDIK